MRSRFLAAAMLVFAANVPDPCSAQPSGRTGDMEGSRSPITAPNTAPTGRVVPRPGSLDPATVRNIEKRTKEQEEDASITRGICVGCT